MCAIDPDCAALYCVPGAAAEGISVASPGTHSRLRRSLNYYRALPDFWGWYKYYTETNNQEGVSAPTDMLLATNISSLPA